MTASHGEPAFAVPAGSGVARADGPGPTGRGSAGNRVRIPGPGGRLVT